MNKKIKFINNVDTLAENKTRITTRIIAGQAITKLVITQPREGGGILKYIIRLLKSFYVLVGKADAITYTNNH